MTIQKGDEPLDSLDLWSRLAGPKSPDQWKDYRSAKECARAWLEDGGRLPDELRRLIEVHEDFGEIVEWKAEPEAQVRFDEFGGPANIDVLVHARDRHGTFVVAVEAKADESFGRYVSRQLSDSLERLLSHSRSKALARVEALVAHVLGPKSGRALGSTRSGTSFSPPLPLRFPKPGLARPIARSSPCTSSTLPPPRRTGGPGTTGI